MSWELFRKEFPNTKHYDNAFSHYLQFYGNMPDFSVIKQEIQGYAEFHQRAEEIENKRCSLERFGHSLVDYRLPALERELNLLLSKQMTNEEQDRVVILCHTIILFKVTDDMYRAVEILIRNVHGAVGIESFIDRLVKTLPPGSEGLKRLSISLDLEYSLEAMKKIAESRNA
jgi:hypothetical protein